MIFAMMVLVVGSLLTAAALASVTQDAGLTQTYISQQKAYFAALAGIGEYKYKLSANPNYWLQCPTSTQQVAGTTDETYTVKTVGANGHANCESEKQATIIELSGSASGTFRIESTGTSPGNCTKEEGKGVCKRSIVATLTHPGFLNYVFLSNYEVEDPATLPAKPTNCAHYLKERETLKVTAECPPIPFIGEDEVNGPFHTNDGVAICDFGGNPKVGRKPPSSDVIEMNQGHYKDTTHEFCGEGLVTLEGKYTETGATLTPPETDTELLAAAEYKFKGRTVIELETGSPNKMKVTSYNFSTKKFLLPETKPFPTNGVIYVENEVSCPIEYSPFKFSTQYKKDQEEPECGNVYIKGNYTESLTVAAQGDVIVTGNLETTPFSTAKPTGNATLGLIATNYVRVYHPVKPTGSGRNERTGENCEGKNETALEDTRTWGSLTNPVVDAAILSTSHSFIVDNFLCGANLGTLTVWGAIAQNWRGRVRGKSSFGGFEGGYVKEYNYDERLASKQPPNFLSPTTSSWHLTRQTAPQSGCC
jgi:hypothetical protein